MSVIRQDPTTREWVIIAAERMRRPHEYNHPDETRLRAAANGPCPFCPGHEASTPEEAFRLPDSSGTGWAVRVTSNKFPALGDGGGLERRETGPLFREMDGVGTHEVIIETPAHDRTLAIMTDHEVADILTAYQARYRALRKDPRLKYIMIFKNHLLRHPGERGSCGWAGRERVRKNFLLPRLVRDELRLVKQLVG